MTGMYRSALGPMLKNLKEKNAVISQVLNQDELTNDDYEKLRQRIDGFKKLIEDIEIKNQKWTDMVAKLPSNERADEVKIYSDFKFDNILFTDWIVDAKKTLEIMNVTLKIDDDDNNSTISDSSHHRVRHGNRDEIQVFMPKLRLPDFNGDPHEWQSFWQSFESSVHNKNYKGIDKMKFLMMCLHGEAKDAIADIKLSNLNYEIAIEILKKRFGDSNILIEALQAELFHVPVATDSGLSLKKTIDSIEKICRQMKALDQSVDKNPLLIGVIKSKLSRQVRLDMAKEEEYSEETWTALDLRKALTRYVTLREKVFLSMKHFPEENYRSKNFDNKNSQSYNNRPIQGKKQNFVRTFQAISKDYSSNSNNGNANNENANNGKNWNGNVRVPDCLFCDGIHWASKCLRVVRPEDRMKRLAEQERCFLCLKPGHKTPNCTSSKNCQICNGRHNTLVCLKQNRNENRGNQGNFGVNIQYNPTNERKAIPNRPKKEASWSRKGPQKTNFVRNNRVNQTSVQVNTHNEILTDESKNFQTETTCNHLNVNGLQGSPCDTILMAQKVPIYAPNNPKKVIEALVFFDTGSQTSYIKKDLVRKLNPPKIGEGILEVNAFQTPNPIKFKSGQYVINFMNKFGGKEQVILYSTDKFAEGFKAARINCDTSHMKIDEIKQNIQFINQEPDILLGITEFWKFFIKKNLIEPGFYLIETIVGPIVCGRIELEKENKIWKTQTNMILHGNVDKSDENLVFTWWDLETLGIKDKPDENEDETAMNLFNKSIHQVDKRYRMKWVWKDENPDLPSNYSLAYKCLESILRRLQSLPSSDLLEKYDGKIKEQLEKGIIEEAGRNDGALEHYLPHHPVITHKLRLVYNASAKTRNGKSLNECLFRGPVLLPDLAGMLLRFRLPKHPLMADIESAFLMLELEEEDREVTKFLWIKNINAPLTAKNLIIYRFQRVAFGVICSPFLLSATILHHLNKYPERPIAQELGNNSYVDNVMMNCETIEELMEKYKDSKEIFSEAAMNLREYITNSEEFMTKIPEKDRLDSQKPKVLGLQWNLMEDVIEMKFPKHVFENKVTRRSVLQDMASLFDPLGLVGPCVVKQKLFFQKTWNKPKTWDEPIDREDEINWRNLMKLWENQIIKVQRRIVNSRDNNIYEIHVLVDASEEVYACNVYLRVISDGKFKTSLLFSKNRMKSKAMKVSIPRMELLGLLIGVRSKDFVEKELNLEIAGKFVWTDSKAILCWLKNDNEETKPRFICNRLAEVRNHLDCTFNYVPTEENPADIATRGASPDELRFSQLWWKGPEWLEQDIDKWPNELKVNIEKPMSEEEVIKQFTGMTMAKFIATSILLGDAIDLKRFSSWHKLLKTIKTVLFVKEKFKKTVKKEDLDENRFSSEAAENLLLRLSQMENLEEIGNMRTIFNEDKLYRLDTRIKGVADQNMAQPIILPKNAKILKLLIDHFHRKFYHSGVETTLTNFLCKFWTPKARRQVKSVVKSCLHCQRMKAYPYQLPMMPTLPLDRIKRSSPFESVGIDYLGPSVYLEGSAKNKFYIILITCLSTRAVYLEPVKDLSTKSFMLVFRRFVARRGCPKRIISDNGTQFRLAAKVIELSLRETSEKMQWKFINQISPWQGGVYERLVALVKNIFKRTLGKTLLEYEELCTFIAEAESILNRRPLTVVDESMEASRDGYIPLRPIDFLIPRANMDFTCDAIVENYPSNPAEKMIRSWKNSQEILNDFWKRWEKEYLILLRERSKWFHKSPHLVNKNLPKVNDVVLVEEKFKPKNLWQLVKIVEIIGTRDNQIRNVKVLFPNGKILSRPINMLYPLEVANLNNEKDKDEKVQLEDLQTCENDEGEKADNEDLVEKEQELDKREVEDTRKEKMEALINKHKMEKGILTRSKLAKLLSTNSIIMMIFFILILFDGVFTTMDTTEANNPVVKHTIANPLIPLSKCDECEVKCTDQGITIFSPEKVNKLEICCGAGICNTHPRVPEFEFNLEKEVLINHYKCEVSFWSHVSILLTAQVICEPTNICDIVNCYICVERFANPKCSPWFNTTLLGSGLLMGIYFTCCFFNCLMQLFSFNLFKHCLSSVRKMCRKRKKRNQERFDEEELLGKYRRKSSRGNYSPKKVWKNAGKLLVIMCFSAMLPMIESGSEVVSISANSEECVRHHGEITCIIDSVRTITLLPSDESVEMLIKNDEAKILGKLEFTVQSLKMKCNAKTEKWLRSYKVETYSVKRCPKMGSCEGDICEQILPDTNITELEIYSSQPGHNHCLGSCSFWWCGCGLATSSCIFYRNYAVPVSEKLYEVFSCPSWEFEITTLMKLDMNGKNETITDLIPGISFHWQDISITPLSVSLPPSPILSEKFISDWENVALIDEIPHDLFCESETAARTFNCTLITKSCSECIPEHDEEIVLCRCKNYELEKYFADDETRLPLTNSKLNLINTGRDIYSKSHYAPIQLLIRFNKMQLTVISDLSKCQIERHELTGCYRCTHGAQLNFTCTSDEGNALAEIICDKGVIFTAKCAEKGTHEMVSLHFDEADINYKCKVECPGGITETTIVGHLNFIQADDKTKFEISRTVRGQAKQNNSEWQNWINNLIPDLDFSSVLSYFFNWKRIIVISLIVLIGIFVLYCFMMLNPWLKGYKLLARTVLIARTVIILMTIFFCLLSRGSHASDDVMLMGGSHKMMNHAVSPYIIPTRGRYSIIRSSEKEKIYENKPKELEKKLEELKKKLEKMEEKEGIIPLVVMLEEWNHGSPYDNLETLFLSGSWKYMIEDFKSFRKNFPVKFVFTGPERKINGREIELKVVSEKSARSHVVYGNTTLMDDENKKGRKLARPFLPPIVEMEGEVIPMEDILVIFHEERDYERALCRYSFASKFRKTAGNEQQIVQNAGTECLFVIELYDFLVKMIENMNVPLRSSNLTLIFRNMNPTWKRMEDYLTEITNRFQPIVETYTSGTTQEIKFYGFFNLSVLNSLNIMKGRVVYLARKNKIKHPHLPCLVDFEGIHPLIERTNLKFRSETDFYGALKMLETENPVKTLPKGMIPLPKRLGPKNVERIVVKNSNRPMEVGNVPIGSSSKSMGNHDKLGIGEKGTQTDIKMSDILDPRMIKNKFLLLSVVFIVSFSYINVTQAKELNAKITVDDSIYVPDWNDASLSPFKGGNISFMLTFHQKSELCYKIMARTTNNTKPQIAPKKNLPSTPPIPSPEGTELDYDGVEESAKEESDTDGRLKIRKEEKKEIKSEMDSSDDESEIEEGEDEETKAIQTISGKGGKRQQGCSLCKKNNMEPTVYSTHNARNKCCPSRNLVKQFIDEEAEEANSNDSLDEQSIGTESTHKVGEWVEKTAETEDKRLKKREKKKAKKEKERIMMETFKTLAEEVKELSKESKLRKIQREERKRGFREVGQSMANAKKFNETVGDEEKLESMNKPVEVDFPLGPRKKEDHTENCEEERELKKKKILKTIGGELTKEFSEEKRKQTMDYQSPLHQKRFVKNELSAGGRGGIHREEANCVTRLKFYAHETLSACVWKWEEENDDNRLRFWAAAQKMKQSLEELVRKGNEFDALWEQKKIRDATQPGCSNQ